MINTPNFDEEIFQKKLQKLVGNLVQYDCDVLCQYFLHLDVLKKLPDPSNLVHHFLFLSLLYFLFHLINEELYHLQPQSCKTFCL